MPLALLSTYTVPRARALVGVPLLFIAIYSALPHKELRFVLYAIPPLNVAAAAALAKLYRLLSLPAKKTSGGGAAPPAGLAAAVGPLLIGLGLLSSFLVSILFLGAAKDNYPGALALQHAHHLGSSTAARGRAVHVHIGVDAAMSGVSRFLELGPPWRYSKIEGLEPSAYRQFSYALAAPDAELPGFTLAHMQKGFDGVMTRPPFMRHAPKIAVLRRKKEGAGTASSARSDAFSDL